MHLGDYLDPKLVTLDLRPGSRREVLTALARPVREAGLLEDVEPLVDELMRREEIQSTGVGSGLAIPHCIHRGLDRTRVTVGVCHEGTDFRALDGQPVYIFFLLLSPADETRTHIRLLARIARLSRREERLARILEAGHPSEVVEAVRNRPVPG